MTNLFIDRPSQEYLDRTNASRRALDDAVKSSEIGDALRVYRDTGETYVLAAVQKKYGIRFEFGQDGSVTVPTQE